MFEGFHRVINWNSPAAALPTDGHIALSKLYERADGVVIPVSQGVLDEHAARSKTYKNELVKRSSQPAVVLLGQP